MADIFAADVKLALNGTDLTTSFVDWWVNPSAATSSAQAKYGAASIRFDGAVIAVSGSVSNVPTHLYPGGEHPTDPLNRQHRNPRTTIEAWVRPDSVVGRMAVFDVFAWNAETSRIVWQLIITDGQLALLQNIANASSLPAGSISSGVWTHIAWEVVPLGLGTGRHTVFVNGAPALVYVGQFASTNQNGVDASFYPSLDVEPDPNLNDIGLRVGVMSNTTANPIVGAEFLNTSAGTSTYPNPGAFIGYMDDLRVSSVARYGGVAFTPTQIDLTTPPFAPGDAYSFSAGASAALGTPQIKRQGDGVAAGTTGGTVRGGRVRQTVAGAAGAGVALMESGAEPNPPTITSALTFTALLAADATNDAAFTAAASASTTMASASLRDGALDATLTISPTWVTQMELSGELSAVLSVLANLPQQVDRGTAWVLNVETGATSRYEGFEFNSFGKLGTTYFGCKTDGIYTLGGDDDNGAGIRASVSFGRHDLGSPQLKRMVKAYVDAASTARLFLKITTPQGEFVYEARDFDELLMTQRFDVGRGLEGHHFLLELFNNDGCDFTLAGAEFLASEIMNRRI